MPFELDEFKHVLEDESAEGHSDVKSIIEGIVNESVEALKNTNLDLKDEKKKLQEILDGMPGNDEIEKMRQLQERLDSSEDARLIAEGKMDEVVESRTERYRAKIETRLKDAQDENKKLTDSNKDLKNNFDSFRVDNAIRAAAVEEGVVATAVGDLALRLSSVFKVEDGNIVGRDSDGSYLTDDDGKKLSVKQYIATLKEEAPHFWPASKGGGLNGGSVEQLEGSMFEAAEKGDAGGYGKKRREQLKKKNEENSLH